MNRKLLNTSALLFTLFSAGLHAQPYLAGTVGLTEPDQSGFDDDTGFRIAGGWSFNEFVAAEVAYLDLGEFDMDRGGRRLANAELANLGATVTDASISVDGFSVTVLGTLPVSDVFSVFGRIGLLSWDMDLDVTATAPGLGGFRAEDSDDGTDVSLGLGMEINLTEALSLTAEYTRYDIDEADVELLGAGVKVSF